MYLNFIENNNGKFWRIIGIVIPIIFLLVTGCANNPTHNELVSMKSSGKNTLNSNQLLIEGAHFGDLDLIKVALDQGANIHYQKNDLAPIHQAVLFENYKAAELLLIRGANPNQADGNKGLVPLSYAVQRKNLKMVRLLLSHGAKDIYINNGFSPIEMAIVGSDLAIIKELLESKFSIDFAHYNSEGMTPLMDSILSGNIELFDLLLKHSSNLSLQSKGGYTALHLAVMKKDLYQTKKLISSGADIKLVNKKGKSAEDILVSIGLSYLIND